MPTDLFQYSVVPIGKEKKPLVSWKEYQSRRPTPEEHAKWESLSERTGWALICGTVSDGIFIADLDSKTAEQTIFAKLLRRMGNTLTVESSPGKRHFYFRDPNVGSKHHYDFEPAGPLVCHIDLQADKSYVLIPPSLHPGGTTYKVVDDFPIMDASYTTMEWMFSAIEAHWPVIDMILSKAWAQGQRHYTVMGLTRLLKGYGFSWALVRLILTVLVLAAPLPDQPEETQLAKALTTGEDTYGKELDEASFHEWLKEDVIEAFRALPKKNMFSFELDYTSRKELEALTRVMGEPIVPVQPAEPEEAPRVEPLPSSRPKAPTRIIEACKKIPADLEWGTNAEETFIKSLLVLPNVSFDEQEKAYGILRKHADVLSKYVDFESLSPPKEERENVDEEALNLGSHNTVTVTQEDIARLAGKDIAWAIDILKDHVHLTDPAHYTEMLLWSIQYNIRQILPPEGLFYLGIDGDYSSAKSYMEHILLRLSEGISLNGASEALMRRIYMRYPQRPIGIDEFDDELKERPYLETPIKEGNTWFAPRMFLEPDGDGGWKEVEANVGGPKVLTGATTHASQATLSRQVRIKMQRYADLDMIDKKLWGAEAIADVAKWLKIVAGGVLKNVTPEKVKEIRTSKKFRDQIQELTKDFDIPRGIEIIYLEVLMGAILGWDVAGVLKHTSETQNMATEDTEFVSEQVAIVYKEWAIDSGSLIGTDHGWRKNDKKQWEVLSSRLLEQVNEKLTRIATPKAAISPQRWKYVARELGWSMGKNWFKENRRHAPGGWNGKYYLIFDDKVLESMGHPEDGK